MGLKNAHEPRPKGAFTPLGVYLIICFLEEGRERPWEIHRALMNPRIPGLKPWAKEVVHPRQKPVGWKSLT